jgi:hypothetical protein
MVVIPKKFHLIRASQRKELFIQICGPLILGPGNGTRLIFFSFSFSPIDQSFPLW